MFDLNQASEGNVSRVYQKPGIQDNTVISEVVLEKTTKALVSYVRLLTEGPNGEIGSSPKMFLSTEIKEGKKTSGWGVTARNLVDLIKATHNVDEDTAKGMLTNIPNEQALVNKVSALLVGKPFRAKFKGTTNEKGYIFAELAQVESMKVENTNMKFDSYRDIKPYDGPKTSSTEGIVTANSNDSLSF